MSKWDTNNQPDPEDRLPRGKGKRTLMLEAIEAECGSKDEFFKKILRMGFGNENNPPIPMLLAEALRRIEPPLKPSGEKIVLPFTPSSTHEEKALAVLSAVSNGDISPDTGQVVIGMIKDTISITESTELIKRLEAIEESLKQR